MCGRFSLTTPGELIAQTFGLEETPELEPRYNIAPTQPVLAVRLPAPAGARELVPFRWGLLGPGFRDSSQGPPLINARGETAARKPAFREAFRTRRCLVPADGFYEWRRSGSQRQPVRFSLPDGGVFALAGLWAPTTLPDSGTLGSCVVLTTEPNALVAEVHDRMPVILPPAAWSRWLDPSPAPDEELLALLGSLPAEALRVREVSRAVNDVRNDGPECWAPPRERQQSLF
jgi:putative SOS response-associated peptidase YedK